MIPEYLMHQIDAHRQIEDALFGDTWPPVNGNEVTSSQHPAAAVLPVGVNSASPTAQRNYFCTCAGFRIASDCLRHAK